MVQGEQSRPPLVGCSQGTKFSSKAGKVGLKNMGNSCFMNAGLQCLGHIEPLVAHFLNGEFKNELPPSKPGSKGELAKTFADLLRTLWQSEKKVFDPRTFRQMLKRVAPHLMEGDEQQDVQEFLAFCIDGLHGDLNRIGKAPPPQSEEQDKEDEKLALQEGDDFASALSWLRHLQRERSFLVDLLQGQLRSSVTCSKCGHMSRRYDPFLYLSLPVLKSMQQVTDAIDEYLKPEKLTGDDKWHCEKCKKKQDAKKKIDLWKLPPVLVLHLKRFEFDAKNGEFVKTDNRLRMKLEGLDLSQYCSSEQRDGATYYVACVANHAGEFGDGHYTATCRVDNSWHHFSDSQVKEYTGRNVVTRETYVIFLVRQDQALSRSRAAMRTPLVLRQQTLCKPGNWPHPETAVAAVLKATGLTDSGSEAKAVTGKRMSTKGPAPKESPQSSSKANADEQVADCKTEPQMVSAATTASLPASSPHTPARSPSTESGRKRLRDEKEEEDEEAKVDSTKAASPEEDESGKASPQRVSMVARPANPVKKQRSLVSMFEQAGVPLRGSLSRDIN